MSYFKNFPTISYPLTNRADQVIQAVDITRRFAIRNILKENANAGIPYMIRDSERAQDIAYRMYDRADLHWVLYLMNDMTDPLRDWPLSNAQLSAAVNSKYPNVSLYQDPAEDPVFFGMGSTVTMGGYSAEVVSFNPTHREIIVKNEINPSAFQIGGVLTDGVQTIQILRKTPQTNALRYFVDAMTGETISSIGSVLTDASYNPIAGWISGSQNPMYRAVTNAQYEEEINESKRKINVLRPEYIPAVINEAKTIFLNRARA